jgi:hypothetical protein
MILPVAFQLLFWSMFLSESKCQPEAIAALGFFWIL